MRKLSFLGLLTISLTSMAQTTLLPYNSSWKYLANGSNQGTNWKNNSFNDAAWSTGTAQLGYGDGDEATVVGFGPNSKKKYITTYFRKTITITDPNQFNGITLNLKRDDGGVVYINGTERFRSNMPTGIISYTTKASAEPGDDGNTAQTISLSPTFFVAGTNVVAVEMHLFNANNADMSFDLQLLGNSGFPTAALTRGPYLQMVNQNATTLRWRTDVATDSKIEVGTVLGSYTLSATNPTSTTEHEVRITGLDADTKYFYRFGSSAQVLQSGPSNFFNTAPPPQCHKKDQDRCIW